MYYSIKNYGSILAMNQTFGFGHVLELDFIPNTQCNVGPISVHNPLWAVSLSFLSITIYELLVLFLSVTGYRQKITEGDMADGLTIRYTDTQTDI